MLKNCGGRARFRHLICVSVRWDTLWVHPPPLCVRSIGLFVCQKTMCVRLLGYIVGASPLVYVLSLEGNLRWILACCLLRFATFFEL